ncbi:unnamed protein product [Chilo suppressalis]|uniref:Aminopeptidase n=1 Tax=Chilo suppressalis TaxID=168631 RepID=A0ABN8EC14_CHISP|nr:unnamed protein product [Chilo suppressalis]
MALFRFVFISALLVLAKSEFPIDYSLDLDVDSFDTRNDDQAYRLPEDLDPEHADIEITPYFDSDTTPPGKEQFTFDGIATLRIRAVKNNLTSVIVQENVREIQTVTLVDIDTGEFLHYGNETTSFERIREYHFLKVNLKDGATLRIGRLYKLHVVYIGNINETPLSRGMFRGYYRDQNNYVRWYSATHLQPTHSRQLFPSFDEPGFKSTFNIVVNRPIRFTETYSNMPLVNVTTIGDRVKEVFQTTPRMSAYLISIHISDGFTVIAEYNNPQKPYRIIARPTASGQGRYAMAVGPPLTEWFDNYFGINYYDMADGLKNDQLASPFWASGATENWGLVTYRELRLLNDENETNALDRMYIGTITAHELAHKWFGNLITCRWWDNVWINEGFASYFEYFGMDGIAKSMELEDQFIIMYLQSALSADASPNTRALRHTVNSPTQVTGHFTGISYSKGASFLLMLKHMVTEETFKKALHLFLIDRAYQYATPEDLFRAFQNATDQDNIVIDGLDIISFMTTWVDQPGYPLLNVDVNMNTGLMNLTQERFYINENTAPTNETWPLPLTFTSGKDLNWDNLNVSRVMTSRTAQIQKEPGHDWVIFNVQQRGIYRVNYDTHTWEMIASTLNSNHNAIHHINRAQIVDDIFALMRSGKITFQLGFHVLEFLKKDTSYYSWYPALTGFNWIRNRFLHMPDVLAEFDAILYKYLDAVITNVLYFAPSNERLTNSLNRIFVLSFACNIGHPGCVADAVEQFRRFNAQPSVPVHPNLRRHVFCTGLREGTYENWQAINNRMRNSNNQADELAMLRALGCTNDYRAVEDFMNMVVSDDIKAQDKVNAITWLLAGNRNNSASFLEFLKAGDNVQKIRQAVILPASFNTVLSTLASYLDVEGLNEMERWLNENQQAVPEFNVGLSAINSARANQQWGTDKARDILEAVRDSSSVLVPSIMLVLSTMIALMLK